MNELKIFSFESNKVRTQLINEVPWFVGKDIASTLGYIDTSDALKKHVDNEDSLIGQITDSGQRRNMIFINESGLYSLILKSKLPNAKKFKRWVTSEVLPTIRKHGIYATENTIEKMLSDPDTAIKLLETIKNERTQRLIAEQRVNELQPKADYYDNILKNKSLMTISVVAKNYGISARKMNTLLHELGVQYRQSDTWLLYSKHQDKGYTHTEMLEVQGSSNLKPSTKWTQKGHIFIYQLLKQHDVLPVIERKNIA